MVVGLDLARADVGQQHDARLERCGRGGERHGDGEQRDVRESLGNLEKNLREHGFDLATIPYVLQLNKRDLPNVAKVEEMVTLLRKKNEPVFEAVAAKGTGVFETLKGVAKLVLQELTKTG